MSNFPGQISGRVASTGGNHNITPTLGASGVKGTWVQAFSATAFDSNALRIRIGATRLKAPAWIDVGVGASGSEIVIINNLPVVSQSSIVNDAADTWDVLIPQYIPTGTRIAVRGATGAETTDSAFIDMHICFLGNFDRKKGGAFRIGDSAVGTNISAATAGAWSQLCASCASDVDGLYFTFTDNGGYPNTTFDVGIGAAGSEVALATNISICQVSYMPGSIYLPIAIPRGSRVSARFNNLNGTAVFDAIGVRA